MKYNPKEYQRRLTRYIARQAALIQKIIDGGVSQSVLETERFGVPKGTGADFFFRDYPGLSRKVDSILKAMSLQLNDAVEAGIEWGWTLANAKNDDMVWQLINSIGSTRVPYEAPARWMQKNLPALEAFENRRINGMGISERVWKTTSGMKGDLELALDLGLGEGKSADRLSRDVRSYLREPDRLYRRVRDEKGVLRLSESAANYHPGQGVYRSSYMNARRLAATETNIAYNTADFERNQELDFVLGIEVHLSNNHTCLNAKGIPMPFHDICDELKGRYPKDFKFTGWHPFCRCYATTILPTQEEMINYLAEMDEEGMSTYEFTGYVEDVPPGMKEWLEDNEERVLNAKSLPYFITDNPQISISDEMTSRIEYQEQSLLMRNEELNTVERAARMVVTQAHGAGDELQAMAEEIAAMVGGGTVVTPINYKTFYSVARKANLENISPFDLKDAVRNTIVTNAATIPEVLKRLQALPGFSRLKRQTPDKFFGYSGNIVNVRLGNGMTGEIQVNTYAMIYAKNDPRSAKRILGEDLWNEIYEKTGLPGGLGHAFYEKWRALPKDSPLIKELQALQEEYYSHFRF